MTRRQEAGVRSSGGGGSGVAAALTSKSRDGIDEAAVSTAGASPTSTMVQRIPGAAPGFRSHPCTSQPCFERSDTMALPMPPTAPVTTALLAFDFLCRDSTL